MLVKDSIKIKVDKLRKIIHRELKSLNLKVKITTNIKQADFRDVTLDLMNDVNDVFQPYIKANANPIYIHPDSNHPSSVIKNKPSSIIVQRF